MISVIMLTLKKEPYLAFAVASVMETQDVELILVCPNLEDPSSAMFPRFLNAYGDRIQIISKTDNSPAEGLNNGLMNIRGEIVAILNGDDFYLPGGLAYAAKTFELNPDLDLLLGGGLIIDQDSNLVKHVIPGNLKYATRFQDTQGAFTFLHQSMFYRVQKFKQMRFNEENLRNWDTEFLISMLDKNPNMKTTNRALAAFRISRENLSSQIRGLKTQNKEDFNGLSSLSIRIILKKIFSSALRTRKFLALIKWTITCQLRRENYRRF